MCLICSKYVQLSLAPSQYKAPYYCLYMSNIHPSSPPLAINCQGTHKDDPALLNFHAQDIFLKKPGNIHKLDGRSERSV